MQLDLPFFGTHTVRGCLLAYLATQCDHVADATRRDYEDRAAWLMKALGEATNINVITLEVLERLVMRYGPKGEGLMLTTLRKRLTFLLAALKYAHERGALAILPPLPRRQLKDDGRPRKSFLTPEQYDERFRPQMPPGPFRRVCDVGFWTGMHTYDLFGALCGWFRPDEPFIGPGGEVLGPGQYLRHNHKNPRCAPVWLPMEPEFALIMRGIRAELGARWTPHAFLVGKVWNLGRTMAAASDRAQLPRVAPIDLRRSFATMLVGRGYPNEYVRHALGHEGEYSRATGRTLRPSTATRHYLQFTPGLARRLSSDPQGQP